MAEQGEFLEIGGTKVYKSLFKNEGDWNKLVESQSGSSMMKEEQAKREAEQKRKQEEADIAEKERLAKVGITLGPRPEPKPQAPVVSPEEQAAIKAEEELTAQAAQPTGPAAQPPQPPVVQTITPAMVQETAITTVSQSPEAKKAVKMYEEATKASIVANQEKAGFDIQRANTLAAAKEREAQQMELDLAETKKVRDEQTAQLKLQQDKMNATAQELQNYQFKNFFEGREGARAMAGLSIALGSVGAAFGGGPNYAMEIIQNSIQNDLAVQKANYDKLKGTFEGQRTLYGQLVDRFKDENVASQTMMKIRYDQMAKQAEAAAAKISDPEAKARIDALKAQMQQEGAKAMMSATEGLKTSVQTQIKQAARQAPKDILEARASFEKKWKEGDNEIGQAIRAQNAAEKFRSLIASGASEQAVADFIAGKGGLGQGSYSPAYENLMNKMGGPEKVAEMVRGFIKGGTNPETVQKIQNFLDVAAVQTARNAAPRLPQFMEEAAMVQLNQRDTEALIRQINAKGLKLSDTEKAGARRISP